jgi:hypothetical protein
MRRIFFSLIITLNCWNSVSAASFPFTDVVPTDSYYNWVRTLYEYWIITNNGDNLFRPNDPISRDVFVGLATSVSCKKCLIPSTEDIIKYRVSPFIDLEKSNPNYYCIAYAAEKNIVQGYIVWPTGAATCQNNSSYNTPPFCSDNNTSRIEAIGMLLRQAWLWDDIRNASYSGATDISDVSTYWHGYAEKWIQAELVTLRENNKIYPDEIISRWEFANMAAKILWYNQCNLDDSYTVESEILTRDISGNTSKKNRFPEKSNDVLAPITSSSWSYEYRWTLTNPITGEVRRWSDSTYPIDGLPCGQWITEVDLIDKTTGLVVSQSTKTIIIDCWKEEEKTGLTVTIEAKPLVSFIDNPIDFTSNVTGWIWKVSYRWDFWDGSASGETNPVHTYTKPWTYTVTLTITDENGNTTQSRIVVRTTWDKDSDKDGTLDATDLCQYVVGPKDNRGCPKINTTNYTDIVQGMLWWILVNNNSNTSILSWMSPNSCLLGYQGSQWLIVWTPVCDTCPCQTRVDILASMRSCDIIFPTILSVDKTNIFVRGWFYQIP